jgi:hypothetical protein
VAPSSVYGKFVKNSEILFSFSIYHFNQNYNALKLLCHDILLKLPAHPLRTGQARRGLPAMIYYFILCPLIPPRRRVLQETLQSKRSFAIIGVLSIVLL